MVCCAIGAVSANPDGESRAKKLPTDSQGALYRFVNKRASTKYVTAEGDAVAGANLKSTTDLSQIWVVVPIGDGYNILNAATGKYLGGEEYNMLTSTATKYYIRYKFAYGSTDDFYEVSTDAKFAGKTLMNMSPEYKMATWNTNDEGSLWTMEEVYDVSVDEVREHILNNGPFAKELQEGAYYRIQNINYGSYLTQDESAMVCRAKDPTLFDQYWTVKKSGTGWQIRNLLSDDYIGQQGSISTPFPVQATAATMHLNRTADKWCNTWNITNTAGSGTGMHCDAAMNVVLWYNDNPSNAWGFEEVELSQEEIDAAKGELNEFKDMVANRDAIQATLDAIFADKGATTLNDTYAAMTDEQLAADKQYQALPAALRQVVLKVKNNAWGLKSTATTEAVPDGSYERFFRINSYMPYSNYDAMAWETGQSNQYGKLSTPTGIKAGEGEIIYVFVNEDVPAGTTLQAEAVNITPDNCGGNRTGNVATLKKGLNLLRYNREKMLFIFYQQESTKRSLANLPNLNIHIEGGEVYGTFDVTRGMTNRDWTNMMQAGLLQNFGILTLKSPNLVMLMNRVEAMKALENARRSSGTDYTDVELLMYVWNTIVANEEHYQGLEEKFGSRYRNVWNAFSIDHSYMYASTNGTYYENGTLSSILNYHSLTHDPGSLWGPSHEMGHNHQALINCVGCTEVSNNLFSNINVFEAGISNTRGTTPKRNFAYLADKTPWPGRDIWTQTKMYFQLYLYFHAQGADAQFLQKLFAELRKDPMTKEDTWETVTAEGEQKSCRVVYGKNDYLKFAEKCCKAAQMDLSEFFEAYGFFIPVEKRYVGDYADYVVTTTQTDINLAKARMQRYKKKGGNIMFINDYAVQNPADPDNKFKAVPDANGLKKVYSNESQHYYGNEVTTGNHLLYGQTADYQVTGDYYTLSGSTISFKGKGYLGHKVYDLDGNLIWAVANEQEEIPASILGLFPDKVVVTGADQNLGDVPCPYFKSGTSPLVRVQVTFPTGAGIQWNVNKNFDHCMPENAVAVVTSATVNDEVLSTKNVVSKSGVARQVVIDGNQEMVIPRDFTAQALTFTKRGTGFQALQLPFDMADTLTVQDSKVVEKSLVAAGEPVVTQGKVSLELQGIAVKAGEFKIKESGFALNTAGDAVQAATSLSPFTYCFSGPADITIATGINDVAARPGEEEKEGRIFDLSGRRVSNTKSGLYIINGKKALVK